MPQGRIPDKFRVLEKPKEEQNLTFFFFFLFNSFMKNVYKLGGLFKGSIKLDRQENTY